MNVSCSTSPEIGTVDAACRGIDLSSRPPVLVLFFGAALWLLAASIFGMLASLRFHSPTLLADAAWLTYGRVYAAATSALLYGFAIPAGMGAGLWIIARLGRTPVVQPWLIAFGGLIWNVGVLVGILAILNGDSTGYENLEMPKAAAALLFIGYCLMGIWTLLTVHARQESGLDAPQWFLLAALFWFPWIFSTAHLLLTVFPVRGVTQSVVHWWFSANLKMVWLGLVGLATAYYLITQLLNRAMHSQYLALFTFWTVILFASWTGIPASAPVPAWIPAISTVATVLTLITVLTVAMNVYHTVCHCDRSRNPISGKFVCFGISAFCIAWLLNLLVAIPEISPYLTFTWFTVAQNHLNVMGFFTMTLVGAIYYIVPRACGAEWPCGNRIRANYWLLAIGIVLYAAPLLVGGVIQGIKLNDPQVAFAALSKSTLMPLRVSSLGEVLILTANALLVWNLTVVIFRQVRAQLRVVETPASVPVAEVKS
jgi:cytochrome c oxidase cbb3-type subunit 1